MADLRDRRDADYRIVFPGKAMAWQERQEENRKEIDDQIREDGYIRKSGSIYSGVFSIGGRI